MLPRIDEEITFRKLEILLAFMESGNLARAAERLGVSAVSVHRALHSLETGTRCTLFRLEGRNLQPNDAAQALAEVAREVLRTMTEGIRSTREIAGYASERIRIGSLYSLTSGTVPALVMGLKLRKPDIQTELVLGSNNDLLRKLREGVIDAALMGQPEDAADVESQVLFEDDIFFAAPAGSRHDGQSEIDLGAWVPVHLRTIHATDRFSPTSRFSGKGTGPVGLQRSVVARTASSKRKLMLMDTMSELDASNRNCRISEGLEAFH